MVSCLVLATILCTMLFGLLKLCSAKGLSFQSNFFFSRKLMRQDSVISYLVFSDNVD